MPTPGSRPHDPLATRDGAIWWTGQLANTLGRLDPRTGQVKEYVLKTPHTGPHGLTEDKDGNIWFTGNNVGLIGKLDPKTGAVTEYRLPNPDAKDPHTLIFDHDGILWFTVQQANMVGRLDPKLATSSSYFAHPEIPALWHGTELQERRVLRRVRRQQGREHRRKDDADNGISAAQRWRTTAAYRIGPDDMIWYTDFARGFLGRLDVNTGAVDEWPSPGGPKSEPYGIVFTKGALWYNETGAKPNTIVRFDPLTENFRPGSSLAVATSCATLTFRPMATRCWRTA